MTNSIRRRVLARPLGGCKPETHLGRCTGVQSDPWRHVVVGGGAVGRWDEV